MTTQSQSRSSQSQSLGGHMTTSSLSLSRSQSKGVPMDMLNPTPQEINRICKRMAVKAVVCDDNGSQAEVFSLKKGGYLVSVEQGDYAYWTNDIDVAVRLWMSCQEDNFWKEALIEFGGEPDADEFIILHHYNQYNGFH